MFQRLNVQKVLADPEVCSIVKTAIYQMQNSNGAYLNIGKWFAELNDSDLGTLHKFADTQDDKSMFQIVCLSEALALAEGMALAESDDEDITRKASLTIMYIFLESLFRKGIVDLDRDNMSFSPEKDGATIAQAKPGVIL